MDVGFSCFARRTTNITGCNVAKSKHFEGRIRFEVISKGLTDFS
jgi:hypothetical protein